MSKAPLRVLPTPDAIGEALAERLLAEFERARLTGRQFLLGCPTGRTPKPLFAAMARRLTAKPQDLSQLVFVMMDEYLVQGRAGLEYAPADAPWSCHHFARVEIADRLNAALSPAQRIRADAFWFPDPRDPAAYDARIDAAGGIDFFLLASGASDGHVAFNPPGSARESRTRVIPLSDETRRDNLKTFPAFGTLDAVPRHGVSVGIDTIIRSRTAVMVAWGKGKRLTVARMRDAGEYEADWPATLIHECASAEILCDDAANSTG
jgi:glucosamine-6-phosphate deaminase